MRSTVTAKTFKVKKIQNFKLILLTLHCICHRNTFYSFFDALTLSVHAGTPALQTPYLWNVSLVTNLHLRNSSCIHSLSDCLHSLLNNQAHMALPCSHNFQSLISLAPSIPLFLAYPWSSSLPRPTYLLMLSCFIPPRIPHRKTLHNHPSACPTSYASCCQLRVTSSP